MSSEVKGNGGERNARSLYDFLLLLHGNYAPFLHRYRVATLSAKLDNLVLRQIVKIQ